MISRKLALAAVVLFACGAPTAPEDSRHQKFGANIVNPSVPQPQLVAITQAGGVFTLNPTFTSTTMYVDLNCTTSICQLVGITAPPTNGTKICIADTGTQSTQYFHLNGSASAANRLSLLDGSTATVGANAGFACLIYDTSINTGSGAWAQEGFFPTDVAPSSWTVTNGLTVSAAGAAITGAVGVTSGDIALNTAGKAFILIQNSGTATTSKLEAFSGSPNGTVTSTNKGDVIIDTTTPTPWFATAASSTVWMREPGVYLGQQKLTASSGTYTPNSLARVVRVRMIGGGGGGGGASGTAAQFAAGGGGSSGAMLEVYVNPGSNTLITGGSYAIGAAGTAGAAAAGNGGNGGDTTIVIQGVTYTAKGGSGGAGMATGTTLANSNGATPQAGSTALSGACAAVSTCVVALTWGNGDVAVRVSGSGGWGGNGGSTSLGGGGQYAGVATGTTATGYGGGGAGAGAQTTSDAGGAGFQGVILVDEFD